MLRRVLSAALALGIGALAALMHPQAAAAESVEACVPAGMGASCAQASTGTTNSTSASAFCSAYLCLGSASFSMTGNTPSASAIALCGSGCAVRGSAGPGPVQDLQILCGPYSWSSCLARSWVAGLSGASACAGYLAGGCVTVLQTTTGPVALISAGASGLVASAGVFGYVTSTGGYVSAVGSALCLPNASCTTSDSIIAGAGTYGGSVLASHGTLCGSPVCVAGAVASATAGTSGGSVSAVVPLVCTNVYYWYYRACLAHPMAAGTAGPAGAAVSVTSEHFCDPTACERATAIVTAAPSGTSVTAAHPSTSTSAGITLDSAGSTGAEVTVAGMCTAASLSLNGPAATFGPCTAEEGGL